MSTTPKRPSPLRLKAGLKFGLALSLGLSLNLGGPFLFGSAPVQAQTMASTMAKTAADKPSEQRLRQALQAHPQDPQAYQALAEFLLDQLRKDWGRRDSNGSGPVFQAQNDALQRRALELIQLYRQCLALEPSNISAKVDLAEVYFVFQGRYDEAERLLKEALAEQPHQPKANIAMAEFTFFFKKDAPTALKRLEAALEKNPDNRDLSITLADLMTAASTKPEDFAHAHRVLDAALEKVPQDRNLRYMQASVWSREAQLNPKSPDVAKAEKALQIYQELLTEKAESDLSLEAAQIAQSLKRLAQAREIVRQGLLHDPRNPELHFLMGNLWLDQGTKVLDQGEIPPEALEAEKYYRWLMEEQKDTDLLTSEQVQLYYNLGLLAYLKSKAPQAAHPMELLKESESFYRRAVAIFDRVSIINGPLQQDLGRTLVAQGEQYLKVDQKPEAIARYRQACGLKLEAACTWLKQQGMGP